MKNTKEKTNSKKVLKKVVHKTTKSKKKVEDFGDIQFHIYKEQRIVSFYDDVTIFSIQRVIDRLKYLLSLNNKPVVLDLCSYGGSVDAGLILYDFIKTSKATISTRCTGVAASMGAILLMSGKKGTRSISKNSRVMIHQPSGGFIGKASDIEVHARETARIKTLLSTLISQDTGQKLQKVMKDMELDYWMTAEEALKYGLVDRIE